MYTENYILFNHSLIISNYQKLAKINDKALFDYKYLQKDKYSI